MLLIRANNCTNCDPIPSHHPALCPSICLSVLPSIHTSAGPSMHTGPSGLIPSFHWLVHNLHAHHPSVPSTFIDFCDYVPYVVTHRPTSSIHQPTTQPPHWHPKHWSPGVLCAPREWPCWALPSFTGCMPSHISMWQFSTKIVLSPAEQACTICFRLPGPVQATHFVCLALGLPHSTIFRHFLSIFYGIPSTFHSYIDFFCAQAYPTLATITTIIHLGDFSSYGPSAITYPPIPIQQLQLDSIPPHLPVWAWSPPTHPSVHSPHLYSHHLFLCSMPFSMHSSIHLPTLYLSPLCLLSPLREFNVC